MTTSGATPQFCSQNIHFLNVGHGDCIIFDIQNHLTVIDINNCKTLAKESEDELRTRYRTSTPNPFLAGPLSGAVSNLYGVGLAGARRPSLRDMLTQMAQTNLKVDEAKNRLTSPIDYLRAKFPGRAIFRYIQTHPDMDHMAGIHRLLEEGVQIENFWDTKHCIEKDEDALLNANVNKDIQDWHTYQAIRSRTQNPTVLRLTAGAKGNFWTADGIQIWAPFDHRHCLNPKADPNALSYVLFLQVGNCNIVFGGDATIETWEEIYRQRKGLFPKVHLLKASHHGRKSGYHRESVKAMNPDVTILSVGELKRKDDAESRYEQFSKKCFSTLDHGDTIATCWIDGDVWLSDRYGNVFFKSFEQAA